MTEREQPDCVNYRRLEKQSESLEKRIAELEQQVKKLTSITSRVKPL